VVEEWRLLAGMSNKRREEMITRILIAAVLVLSCSLCWAEDFPKDTNKIKSLTAEQAADLIMVVTFIRKENELSLNGLPVICKGVATELKNFTGDKLTLNGLTCIDDEVLQILKTIPAFQFSGYKNLKSWTVKQAAEAVKENSEDILELSLTNISKDIVQELVNFSGRHIVFSELTSIDKEVARELVQFNDNLYLYKLSSIDQDVAKSLAGFKGKVLCLGLTSINKETAQILAQFGGATLSFINPLPINKEVSRELAKSKARLEIKPLQPIDEVSLAYLKSNPNISLPEEYRDKK
jgi:hypothetical protein